jgi:hypothetical protein
MSPCENFMVQIRIIRVFALAVAATLMPSTLSGAETLAWADLLPPRQGEIEQALLVEQRKIWGFNEAQREGYYDVAYELSIRTGLADGTMKESELLQEDRDILEGKPAEKYPEAVEYWKNVEKMRMELAATEKQIPSGMSGRKVRIPGYVLPLEFEGDKVTEFLLVPYVGACVHAPAPPSNQIVFVKPDAPFVSEGLYSPVWIDGMIDTRAATHDLSLIDGTAPVDVGYMMEAAKVTAYKRKQ